MNPTSSSLSHLRPRLPTRWPRSGPWQRHSGADPGISIRDPPQPLPVAAELTRALDKVGVRYGVIQDSAGLQKGLAGLDDIDLLVEKADHGTFCAVVAGLNGIRGVSLACYDNVCAGREDWFIPDFTHGKYLHLDVHIGLRVGWGFRKRYLLRPDAFLCQWERVKIGDVNIPVATPDTELRRAITRFAFGSWTPPWKSWLALCGLGGLFSRIILASEENQHRSDEILLTCYGPAICRIRREDNTLLVHRGDLRKLRRRIRSECGFRGPTITDCTVHLVRKTTYLMLRLVQRLAPHSIAPKRRPANGGLVVALVGPDGVGKSTQVDRLVKTFRWKFGCVKSYAGTGDGKGWWTRKLAMKLIAPHKHHLKSAIEHKGSSGALRNWTSFVSTAGLAFWGLLIAVERYAMVRRAHRSATRGLIVICDRWPQSLQRGYLDGPVIPTSADHLPVIKLLARLERTLYRRMQEMRPHLTLHLVSDYSVSERRKPGGIRKEAFDARLSLMAELRRIDPEIKIVDASESMETVFCNLFRHVWLFL